MDDDSGNGSESDAEREFRESMEREKKEREKQRAEMKNKKKPGGGGEADNSSYKKSNIIGAGSYALNGGSSSNGSSPVEDVPGEWSRNNSGGNNAGNIASAVASNLGGGFGSNKRSGSATTRDHGGSKKKNITIDSPSAKGHFSPPPSSPKRSEKRKTPTNKDQQRNKPTIQTDGMTSTEEEGERLMVRVIADFEPTGENQLEVEAGSRIEVVDMTQVNEYGWVWCSQVVSKSAGFGKKDEPEQGWVLATCLDLQNPLPGGSSSEDQSGAIVAANRRRGSSDGGGGGSQAGSKSRRSSQGGGSNAGGDTTAGGESSGPDQGGGMSSGDNADSDDPLAQWNDKLSNTYVLHSMRNVVRLVRF
jgi:hypothetical protein